MLRKSFKNANLLPALGVFFFFILFAGCSSESNVEGPAGFIQIKGSDTIVNAAQMLAEDFMKDYPYIFVAVTGGGSGVGIASLINKTCDIADASRKMKLKEIEMAERRGVEPKEFVVAYDGVAVIVNKRNTVNKLTIKNLHDIFTGKITSWKAFGGPDKKIIALSREVSSGTHMYFKEKVIRLGNKKSTEEFSPGTLLLTSSQAIVEEVANNDAAIGYLGMGYTSDRTKSVMIKESNDFYPPTVEFVSSGKYPLSRPLQMYTNGKPKGVVKIFMNFVFSPKGQNIFRKTGFVPLKLHETETD